MRICNLRTSMDSAHATVSISDLSSLPRTSQYAIHGVNKQRLITVMPPRFSRSRPLIQCSVRFRPCIDIHKGKVKQIVGSTLGDSKEGSLITNFESDKSAAEFANLYKQDGLLGGHVIMLGADPLSKSAAIEALHAHPGGLQVGGGINSDNALNYIEEGASHVIITSYVFNNGQMDLERLKDLVHVIGKQRLVLDLSCRKKEGKYAIVTDRWQKFSDVYLDEKTLDFLAIYADEFLVHGVDVEGKRLGIDEELVALLGKHSPLFMAFPSFAGDILIIFNSSHLPLPDISNLCWWRNNNGRFREDKGGRDGTRGCYCGELLGYIWRQLGIQGCRCLACRAGGPDSLSSSPCRLPMDVVFKCSF